MRQDLVRVRRLCLPLQGTVGHSRAHACHAMTRTGQGPDKDEDEDEDKDEDKDKDKDEEPR